VGAHYSTLVFTNYPRVARDERRHTFRVDLLIVVKNLDERDLVDLMITKVVPALTVAIADIACLSKWLKLTFP
jgi:hypothetical protein